MSEIPTIGTDEWTSALGHTIKVRRTDIALSRQQLADASSISYSYLSAIENGAKAPSTKILRVLANRLGLETKELLALVDERIARGSNLDVGDTDDVVNIIDRQEQRFQERQVSRLSHHPAASSLQARRELLSLVNTLDDADIQTLTRIAQGLAVLRRSLDGD